MKLNNRYPGTIAFPIIAILYSLLVLPVLAAASELQLNFVNEQGNPLEGVKAQLLLVAWGYTNVVELSTSGPRLELDMDSEWLRENSGSRYKDMEAAFLYLKLEGYSPIRSVGFLPFGMGYEQERENLRVAFPNGYEAVIKKGERTSVDVVFRKAGSRTIKLIDQYSEPFGGVKFKAYMFWSASNHCGRLAGADLIAQGESGADGTIEIPDGENEYALEFEPGNPARLKDKEGAYYDRFIGYLKGAEATMEFIRFKKRPLSVILTKNGKPVEGVELGTCIADCPCGACCGSLWQTDEAGIARIENFYPGTASKIFFYTEDRNNFIWETDPRDISGEGPIELKVSLPDK